MVELATGITIFHHMSSDGSVSYGSMVLSGPFTAPACKILKLDRFGRRLWKAVGKGMYVMLTLLAATTFRGLLRAM